MKIIIFYLEQSPWLEKAEVISLEIRCVRMRNLKWL
jgi:hypothetical protein